MSRRSGVEDNQRTTARLFTPLNSNPRTLDVKRRTLRDHPAMLHSNLMTLRANLRTPQPLRTLLTVDLLSPTLHPTHLDVDLGTLSDNLWTVEVLRRSLTHLRSLLAFKRWTLTDDRRQAKHLQPLICADKRR